MGGVVIYLLSYTFQSESGGDDDSQEGMWDTRSHEEVYSESEDGKSRNQYDVSNKP